MAWVTCGEVLGTFLNQLSGSIDISLGPWGLATAPAEIFPMGPQNKASAEVLAPGLADNALLMGKNQSRYLPPSPKTKGSACLEMICVPKIPRESR